MASHWFCLQVQSYSLQVKHTQKTTDTKAELQIIYLYKSWTADSAKLQEGNQNYRSKQQTFHGDCVKH